MNGIRKESKSIDIKYSHDDNDLIKMQYEKHSFSILVLHVFIFIVNASLLGVDVFKLHVNSQSGRIASNAQLFYYIVIWSGTLSNERNKGESGILYSISSRAATALNSGRIID